MTFSQFVQLLIAFLLILELFRFRPGRIRKLERRFEDLQRNVDAADDFADRLDGQVDALFVGLKKIQAERDALDAYVQELPTFDDLAGSEKGAANVLAIRLRELADAVEADANSEITEEDFESGRVTFDDGTELADLRLAELFAAAPSRPIQVIRTDDLPPEAVKALFEKLGIRQSDEPITPAAVSSSSCDPAAAECSAECLVASTAGISESIIGTAEPRCDDCTCWR